MKTVTEYGNRTVRDEETIDVLPNPSAALNIMDPVTDCSTLELISPDLWITLDGCVTRFQAQDLYSPTHLVMNLQQMNLSTM